MKRKMEYLVSSILFAIGMVIWIINIFMNYHDKGNLDIMFILQCGCAISFSAASVAYFIRYRRSNRSKNVK